jgi:regulator of sigma E protease
MGFLVTPVAFVAVLGIIIFVHEFGHLITAKAFGMRVFVFSFGFGKRLFGFQWGDTDCRVSAIPLGGYVKLEGEPGDNLSEDTVARGDGRDFVSRPRWQRFLVYLAGPIMNALLTITVFAVFFMIGMYVDTAPSVVGALDVGSPAEVAGLRAGDEIVSIDGERASEWEEVQTYIALHAERELRFHVRHGAEEREILIRTQASGAERIGSIGAHPLVQVGQVLEGQPAEAAGIKPDDGILKVGDKPVSSFGSIPELLKGSAGKPLELEIWRKGEVSKLVVTPKDAGAGPRIGIGPKFVYEKYGPGGAVKKALHETWRQTTLTFRVVKGLLTAQISPKSMMGPIGIAQASGEAARAGFDWLFRLVAVISLQVGILNLFPLAPLDGGHLAILAVEGVARRDMSPLVKSWIMNAGAAVIFLLIGLVLYSDISKMAFVQRLLQ